MCVTTAQQVHLVCRRAELVRWFVHRADDEFTVALVGEIDISNEAALGTALAEVVGMKPRRITIDLAEVSYLDSSGVRCLLNAARLAAVHGSEMVVSRPSGIVLRVLEICGVDHLLSSGSDWDHSEAQ